MHSTATGKRKVYLTDSHDTVGSKDCTLEDVDGGSGDCCPVWELPLQHIPPEYKPSSQPKQ